MIYIFRDNIWDGANYIDCEIIDQDYYDLLAVCFQYCKTWSCKKTPFSHAAIEADLLNSQLPVTNEILETYMQYGYVFRSYEEQIFHFPLNAFSMNYLLNGTKDFFEWGYYSAPNLQDICFYRKDGSVFLHSDTHNGICVLEPKNSENVTGIVSKLGWQAVSGDKPTRFNSWENNTSTGD